MNAQLPPLTPKASLRYDVVRRILDDLSPRSVLEVGCGQGAVGARLAARADYLGVEPDEQSFSVAAARITPTGGRVVHGGYEVVPIGTTYDVVCAFEVLEHLEHDTEALTDWVRFVRPGGHLLISVPAFQDRYGPMDELVGHFRRYEPDALVDKLAAVGLDEIRVTLYAWPLGFALESVRNRIDARKLKRTGARTTTERTAASGRTFQPGTRIVGKGIEVATAPFRYLQRRRNDAGTGLVALARRPE